MKRNPFDSDPLLTTTEAAAFCSVDRRTMLRWLQEGALPSEKTPGRRHRVRTSVLRAFMHKHDISIPADLGAISRVLIVDDNQTIARGIKRWVKSVAAHAEIRLAADGFTAGILVSTFKPDLVFLDVVMPGLNGLEVCRHVRKKLPSCAVLILSGHLTDPLRTKLMKAGASECIDKPLRPERCKELVNQYLLAPQFAQVAR